MPIWSAEIKELERLYESFKGQLPDLEKELERLIKADDENMILLYSRRCLEVIITDLCGCELKRDRGTEPLKGIIDKLNKERKVPSHIVTSMHGLNELSTYGAHPKDFDPEQVKPVLVNLDIIIKWYLKYKQIVTIQITQAAEKKVQQRGQPLEEIIREERKKVQEKPDKLYKNKVFLNSIFILVVLAIAATFLYPKIFKKNTLEKLRSSGEKITVAVMPFQNMTNDTTKNFWQEMIQDNLITSLSNSKELKVRQTESISTLLQNNNLTNYASITPTVAGTISQKLDANVFVQGSISQMDTIIRLNAKLIDSNNEEVFKSFQIDGTTKNILHLADSLSVMVRNFLIISELEKEIPEIYNLSGMTNSPEAYRYFIQGRNDYMKEDYLASINWFTKAIAIDSNFFQAMILTSLAYTNQYEYATWFSSVYDKLYLYVEAKKWCLKAYRKMDQMTMQQKINMQRLYARLFETKYEEIKYLKQLIESDDQWVTTYFNLGSSYYESNQYDKAIPEYEKALEIYEKWGLKPYWALNYTYLGQMYYKTGQYKKAEKVFKKAEEDFPNDLELIGWQGILALSMGDTVAANKFFEKFSANMKNMSMPEASIIALLAFGYNEAGVLDKAEEYYRLAQSLESDNPDRVNSLAYFLIDKDRNINEGVKLIDNVLELIPENFIYLHTKGWGLFKQGKYNEALDVLQKSWDLRREKAVYDHEAYLHLGAAKKAVAGRE